jgi:hypothetical protein
MWCSHYPLTPHLQVGHLVEYLKTKSVADSPDGHLYSPSFRNDETSRFDVIGASIADLVIAPCSPAEIWDFPPKINRVAAVQLQVLHMRSISIQPGEA